MCSDPLIKQRCLVWPLDPIGVPLDYPQALVMARGLLASAITAEENVAMPQLVARGWPDAAMFARAGELLARVGLAERRRQLANRLSGGQQQRVAIARALMMAPALVLADEPTGNLDTHSADEVFALLREVNVQLGTSFLIVTHDLRLAQRCDRIVELIDGTIVADRPNPLR